MTLPGQSRRLSYWEKRDKQSRLFVAFQLSVLRQAFQVSHSIRRQIRGL